MAGEWQTLTLGEAGVALIDCDHRTPTAADSGYPYVAIPQLRYGRIDLSDARRISPEHFVEWTRKARPTANDVILSRRCNPGETAFVPPGLEFALGQNLVLLRADGKRVNPRFLRWLTSSPEWWQQIRKFLNVGAVFDSLKCADVPKFELTFPPLPEQRAIAHILGTLDDKIELNRRMSETLEAMARALFKAWFVDFEPVRAKAHLPSPPGRRPTGVPKGGDGGEGSAWPQHILDLFPDRLVDEGKPEGWEMQPLSELLTIIGGGTPKTSVEDYWDGEIPWFSVVDTPPASDVFVVATEKTITDQGLSGSSARLIPKGTTIISARGTVGNLAIAGRDMTFNQSCYGLRGTGDAGDYFVYLTAQQMVDQLKSMAHGSVFSTITRQTFEAIQRPVPPSDVLSAFEGLVTGWFDAILANVEESRTLAQLRDTLLPKLISGELRVPDAERIVGAAV